MNFKTALPVIMLAAAVLVAATGCSRDARLARHRERADSYFKKQEYAKAEVEYLNALRLAPKDVSLMRQLAFIYFEQGRSAMAYQALQQLKQRHPEDADVRFRLGALMIQDRDFTNARVEARFVMQRQATNTAALFLLAECARTPAEMNAARTEIASFSSTHGNRAAVAIALADLDLRENKLAAAEQQLKAASSSAEPANAPVLDFNWARLRFAQTNIAEGESLLKKAAEGSPPRSTYRLKWAEYKVRAGEPDVAREALKEITSQAPDYIPAWLLLADLALAEKRFEECARVTATILQLDATSYQARVLRGRMFVLQDEPEKAIEELTRLEAGFPKAPHVKYHLATTHLRAGETSKGLGYLDQCLRLDPNFTDAVLLKAELDIRAGNAGSAVRSLTELLKRHPEHARAALVLASAHQAQGQFDQALRIYQELGTRFPRNPEAPTLSGVVLRRQGKLKEARAAFERSVQLAPAYLPAVERLVELDIVSTNFPAALERCARITAVLSNSAAPLVLEARVHGAKGDLPAAEAALLRASERDPNALNVYSLLAGLYVDRKEYDKALTRLDAVIARDSKAASAWMQKGVIYEVLNRRADAEQSYRRAIKAKPTFAPALNNLAFLMAEDPTKLEEASEVASKARQAAPLDPSIADTLGWVHFKRRNFVAARRLFAESAEQLNVGEVHYHLGLAEYALGDERAAGGAFGKALAAKDLRAPLRRDAETRVALLNLDIDSATPADTERLQAVVARDPADFFAQWKLGLVHEKQGQIEKAKTALEAANRANPRHAGPLIALARVYSPTDPNRALELAKDARKLAPNDPVLAASLGSLALRSRDYPLALVTLQEGARRGTSSPMARYELALAQFAMGHIPQARSTLQALVAGHRQEPVAGLAKETLLLLESSSATPIRKAAVTARLQKEPNDLPALVARAEDLERENKSVEAARQYEAVLKVSPDFWPARRRLAYLYGERLNDDKSAHTHATAVMPFSPDDPLIAEILGKIAFRKQDFATALRSFQDLTRINPASGQGYYLQGLAQLRLKRTNEARVTLTKALQSSLPPESASETKKLLSELANPQ